MRRWGDGEGDGRRWELRCIRPVFRVRLIPRSGLRRKMGTAAKTSPRGTQGVDPRTPRHAMLREEKRQRMELNAVRFSTQNAENVLLVVGMPVASQGSSPVARGAIRISIGSFLQLPSAFHNFTFSMIHLRLFAHQLEESQRPLKVCCQQVYVSAKAVGRSFCEEEWRCVHRSSVAAN